MQKKMSTADALARFRTDLTDNNFEGQFLEDALLVALENELRAEGLIVSPQEEQ